MNKRPELSKRDLGVKPFGHNVLITPIEDDKTESGILLSTKDEANTGLIVAIGDRVTMVNQGMQVIYYPHKAELVEDYVLIDEDDILVQVIN